MKKIPLTQGKFAIVDDEDYGYLIRFKWYLSGDKKYAKRDVGGRKNRKTIYMQSLLIKGKIGNLIIHKNNNCLDNRKNNLGVVPEKIIIHHRIKNKIRKTSKYKGVCWDKENLKWRATIRVTKDGKRKQYCLGRYVNENDAAKEYNKKAKELYGEFAYQNKIN